MRRPSESDPGRQSFSTPEFMGAGPLVAFDMDGEQRRAHSHYLEANAKRAIAEAHRIWQNSILGMLGIGLVYLFVFGAIFAAGVFAGSWLF
jgi:hypothetical protein